MNALILGFDTKGYSSIQDNNEKKEIRKYLYKIVTSSPIYTITNPIDDLVDTGDGFYLVLNESDYGKIFKLFESFIDEAKNTSKWQIRAAIHVGSVEDDDSYGGKPGKIGNGIDYCSRYLDNEYLKESLNINSEEKFIFGLSDKIVEAVKHETWFDENSFEKYTFTVKAYTGCFYLYKKNLKTLPVQNVENLELKNEQKIKEEFSEFLLQSDFKYKNKQEEHSNLSTFFVFPELTVISDDDENETKMKSDDLLDSFIEAPFNISLFGEEQCGRLLYAKSILIDCSIVRSFYQYTFVSSQMKKDFYQTKFLIIYLMNMNPLMMTFLKF